MKTFSSLVAVVLLVFCGVGWAEPASETVAAEGAIKDVQREMFDKAVAESRNRAVQRYPDAGKEGTALQDAMIAASTRLLEAKSPIMNDPRWPEYVAAKVASDLGILPVKQ